MSFPSVYLMAVPQQYSPVNTDGLWFQLMSASFSQPQFNYIVDVYSWNLNPGDPLGTQSLGTFRIPPRLGYGYGVFTPHKILKSQISNKFLSPINLTGIARTYGGMVSYWIRYGFQMEIALPYYDFQFQGPYFGIKFNQPHGLLVGDIIYVDKTNQKLNPSYGGFQTVTAVIDPYFITTDRNYGYNTPPGADGGYITSLERINGQTSNNLSTGAGLLTWNAVRQYDQKGVNLGNRYLVNPPAQIIGNGSFLTNYMYSASNPKFIKPIRLGQYEVVSFMYRKANTLNQLQFVSYNSNNTVVQSFSVNLTSPITTVGKFDVGIGPANLQVLFPGINWTNVDYYKVFLNQGTFALANIARRIDTSCTEYDVVQLRFLNRAGGYECYNFIRNSKKTLNVSRTEWRQELPWNYQVGDRQQSVLAQKAETSWVINSDWLSEYDYNFLQEVITSPEVYRVSGTYSYPVVITDTSWIQKTYLQEQIFNMTINFKDAYNVMTQDN